MEHSTPIAIAKLILEVQSPSLEDSWTDGYCSSAKGKLEDNPFEVGSMAFHHWQEGWWAGFYDNKPAERVTLDMLSQESASNDKLMNIETISDEDSDDNSTNPTDLGN